SFRRNRLATTTHFLPWASIIRADLIFLLRETTHFPSARRTGSHCMPINSGGVSFAPKYVYLTTSPFLTALASLPRPPDRAAPPPRHPGEGAGGSGFPPGSSSSAPGSPAAAIRSHSAPGASD